MDRNPVYELAPKAAYAGTIRAGPPLGVQNYDEAEEEALKLVAEGITVITVIELCAGFGHEGTARIAKAVNGKALVGVVRFDLHPMFEHQSGDALFS